MLAAGKSEIGFGFKKIEIHFGTPWGYPPVFS
jgi:hypothetical protein